MTGADRARVRALLGWRHDTHIRTVSRLFAERPGLRSADSDAVVTDLVAVCAWLDEDRSLVADPAFAACVRAGLLRLPSYPGVVWFAGPGPGPGSGSGPGAVAGGELVAAGLSCASADPAGDLGAGEHAVWSLTGRRVEGLAPPGRADEVVFAAGTRFVVLGPGLLAELAPGVAGPGQRVRDRLAAATARRAELDAGARRAIADGDRYRPRWAGAPITEPVGCPPAATTGEDT